MTQGILWPVAGIIFCASAALAEYKQDHLCVDGSDAICNILPSDLDGLETQDVGYSPSTNRENNDLAQQINFDYFGWQSFAALNAPADAQGNPVGVLGDDPNAHRVWESYTGIEELFPGAEITPDICPDTGRMTLSQTSKMTTSSFIQPMTPYPLIDVDGNFVLYDIRANDRVAAYLRDNGLDTTAGQQAFLDKGGAWAFPKGQDGVPGAIEVKTSWRLLQDGENPLGYFTLPVNVVVKPQDSATGEALCLEEVAGLVGMHIMHKAATPEPFSQFWIWASFEHQSNAPLAKDAPISRMNRDSPLEGRDPVKSCPVPDAVSGDFGFFNAACTNGGQACAPNAPPIGKEFKWQPEMPYGAEYLFDETYGTQVTRCWDLYETGQEVNGVYQDALAGTVWENYGLIGVQWANHHGDYLPDPMKPFAAPIYMVNATLETYLQINPVLIGDDPEDQHLNRDRPSSCINCHDIATDTVGNPSNFSFLPGYAK